MSRKNHVGYAIFRIINKPRLYNVIQINIIESIFSAEATLVLLETIKVIEK